MSRVECERRTGRPAAWRSKGPTPPGAFVFSGARSASPAGRCGLNGVAPDSIQGRVRFAAACCGTWARARSDLGPDLDRGAPSGPLEAVTSPTCTRFRNAAMTAAIVRRLVRRVDHAPRNCSRLVAVAWKEHRPDPRPSSVKTELASSAPVVSQPGGTGFDRRTGPAAARAWSRSPTHDTHRIAICGFAPAGPKRPARACGGTCDPVRGQDIPDYFTHLERVSRGDNA